MSFISRNGPESFTVKCDSIPLHTSSPESTEIAGRDTAHPPVETLRKSRFL